MSAVSVDSLTEFVGRAVTPLGFRLNDEASVTAFIAELGWELPSVPTLFFGVRDAAIAVTQALGELSLKRTNGEDTTSAAAAVTASLLAFVANLEGLEAALESSGLPDSFLQGSGIAAGLKTRLLDHILISAISASSMARGVLVALGIIEETAQAAAPGQFQPEFVLREVRLKRLGKLFTDPRGVLEDVYGWGTPNIKEERLYGTIIALSFGLISPAELVFPSQAFLSSMFPQVPPGTDISSMVSLPVANAASSAIDVAILPAPKANAADPQALAFRLSGMPRGVLRFGVGLDLDLVLTVDAALDTGIGMLLRPDGDPQLLVGLNGATGPLLEGGVRLELVREQSETPLQVLHLPGGGGLELESYNVRLQLDAAPADVAISAGVDGGRLSVSLAEADGFISSVVPMESLALDFDLGIGWSKRRGIFFTGSAGIETVLVLDQSLGPVLLHALHLALKAGDPGLQIEAGVDTSVKLGPVTASIQGLGVAALLEFESGNLGPMNLDSAFKFPTGIGISVDSSGVSGGGFLYIDQANGRYGGVVELTIYDIAVKAFGLIETKVPGVDFSFVILISAEFPPIQLGFGFTLNGVGGIDGINRALDAAALTEKMSSGALDHLLFPKNVTENAPALISDLQAVFPAAAGKYLFGPLAKLGWGTPTIVEAQLGLILELPDPILTILGKLSALLPKAKSPDTALVKLNMDVKGRLEFAKKHFELDARLRDSTAGGFVLSGQMAMRLDWGDRPNFAISVGGFNPSFTPPPGFPALQRMGIELGLKDNPSVSLTGYFALTSNTAQVGAKLEAWVSKYGATLTGTLGFDAIIVFSPFSFEARLFGGVHVSFVGVGFSLTFEGKLSGPSPWRIQGHVCVGVWFADACVGFNEVLGSDAKPALPSLDPWEGTPVNVALVDQEVGGLKPSIMDMRNWEGVLPPGAFIGVSYVERKPAALRVDPVGVATFRQKSVPLDYPITRFAGTTPTRTGELKVTTVTVGGTPATATPVKDYFAPAQYRAMPEAEQLSSDAFEHLTAGAQIASQNVTIGAVRPKTIEYRTFTIDADGDVDEVTAVHTPTPAQLDGMATASSAARPLTALTGRARFIDRQLLRKVTDVLPTYTVAFRGTLGAVPNLGTPVTRSQAAALLANAAGTVVATRRQLQVTPSFLMAA